MTLQPDELAPPRELGTRRMMFRITAVAVAFAALALATGWHFSGNLAAPHQTIVADPTEKIGPADGQSKNPVTIEKLDKAASQSKQ